MLNLIRQCCLRASSPMLRQCAVSKSASGGTASGGTASNRTVSDRTVSDRTVSDRTVAGLCEAGPIFTVAALFELFEAGIRRPNAGKLVSVHHPGRANVFKRLQLCGITALFVIAIFPFLTGCRPPDSSIDSSNSQSVAISKSDDTQKKEEGRQLSRQF